METLTLGIVALGDIKRQLLDAAAQAAGGALEVNVVIDPGLAEPKYALNPGRSQHHGAAILRKLAQSQLKPGRNIAVAIADVDLFEPEVNFMLADGDRDLGTGVVGLKRLREGVDDERLAQRVRAVVIWAAGHAAGLGDCDDSRCAMYPVDIVDGLERRPLQLCSDCKELLAERRRRGE